MPDAVLQVDGASYDGWESIRVQTSLTQLAGSFSLGVSDKHPGRQSRYKFKLGSSCRVLLDGKLIISGFIDTISPSFSEKKHDLTISGLDVTGDLVSCCHTGTTAQWLGQKLLTIATEICKPFGIPVALEGDQGAAFKDERYSEGETVLAFLAKLCKARGLLPVSYGNGKLIITTPSKSASGGSLEAGGNLLSGRAVFTTRQRHSLYLVKGQGGGLGMDQWSGMLAQDLGTEYLTEVEKNLIAPKGKAADSAVNRHRPLVVIAGGKMDVGTCQKKADFEATSRAGKGNTARYTVQGWTNASGALWRINTTVPVTDGICGVNKTMLIESVDYGLSDTGGTVCSLGLVDPMAYAAEPDTAGDIKGVFDDLQ